MIITSNNTVGMIRSDLISKTSNSTTNNSNIANTNTNTNITSDINIILNLINKARTENNLQVLTLDKTLTNISQLKAKDMVENNYFSHTSKKYGDPFTMMQSFGISYKKAGENIAGNPSIQNAVTSWLKSSTHKKNILLPSYNYVGIGTSKSATYGNIIVVMFIEK